jgi:Ca2+-transporting ATPase
MTPDSRAPFRLPATEVIASLGADTRHGLTDDEASARLARDGPNELAAEPPIPGWRKFVAQFRDMLVVRNWCSS